MSEKTMRDLIRNALMPKLVEEWLAQHPAGDGSSDKENSPPPAPIPSGPAPLFSSEQAAQQIGVTRATLLQWITSGRLKPPRQTIGDALAWTDADIRRLKHARARIRRNRGGRPRKKSK